MTKKIPKIIHQIWLGDKPLPKKLMKTWKDKHPGWQYILWRDESLEIIKFRAMPQIDQMLMAGKYNGAADIMRYNILHELGGFVAPADSICVNPIDDLLDLECFCCYENEKVRPGLLSPIIGTYSGNPLFDFIVHVLENTPDVLYDDAWKVTGNALLTGAVQKTNFPIHILPSYTFLPEHYTGEIYKGKGKIYSRHFWGSTKRITGELDKQI